MGKMGKFIKKNIFISLLVFLLGLLVVNLITADKQNTEKLKDDVQSSENTGDNKQKYQLADPSGNRLNMPMIFFPYGSDSLVSSEIANLDKIANYLSDKPELGLIVEGHCDQNELKRYGADACRSLGKLRADAVRNYLISRGIDQNKIFSISRSTNKPAVQGTGEQTWKQNRRVVPIPIVIE